MHYPIKKLSPELSDTQDQSNVMEDDIIAQFSQDLNFHSVIEDQDDEVSWFRDDVPIKQIPIEELGEGN